MGFGNSSQDKQAFTKYFNCEAFGVDSSKPCVIEVDRRRDQALLIVSSTMFVFAPYVTLIYIVPVDKIKEKWGMWRNHASREAKSSSVFTYP